MGFVAAGGAGFRTGQGQLALELRVDKNVVLTLEETPLSDDQELATLPDGRTRVRASVQDTMDLRGWIKSYGELIEVIAPPELRDELTSVAAALGRTYDVDPRTPPPRPLASTRGTDAQDVVPELEVADAEG